MNRIRIFVAATAIVGGTVGLLAQSVLTRMKADQCVRQLSGNLQLDLFDLKSLATDSVTGTSSKNLSGYKSPLKAAMFSAVIPGAGQTYAERYWQGLAFFGAEVGLWIVYAAYESKGNQQTTDFQNFADNHWSVVRYVTWFTTYSSQLAPGITVNTAGIITNPDPNLKPWQQVDWVQLNGAESQIMQVTGNGFTHNLPHRPDQQYYELIGKYPQFLGGWDDGFNSSPSDVVAKRVSSNFSNYSHQRGRANDLYNIASSVSYVLVANHILSALEAAWTAAEDNSNLKMGATLEMQKRNDGMVEFIPTAKLQLEF